MSGPSLLLRVFDLPLLLQDNHLRSEHHINILLTGKGNLSWCPPSPRAAHWPGLAHVSCAGFRGQWESWPWRVQAFSWEASSANRGKGIRYVTNTSATVTNSVFSPFTVAKGSLGSVIELELNGLNHNYDKLVLSRNQFLSGFFFPFTLWLRANTAAS